MEKQQTTVKIIFFLIITIFILIFGGPEKIGAEPWHYSTSFSKRPWWDYYPTIVQTHVAKEAIDCHGVASLCGAADDPTWGIFLQRTRFASLKNVKALHQHGIKALSWIETFGTTQAHIVLVKKDAAGNWVHRSAEPLLTRVFRNAWNWKNIPSTGVVRWAGIHNYFDPEDFLGPFTFKHPRYGCPPMTYPDGTPALGFTVSKNVPWSHRIYDAACAKNVLGQLYFDDHELDHGQIHTGNNLNKIKILRFSIGKDSACPIWIDYLRASIRDALDLGINGVWADNFSPWDSLNAIPLKKAFGDWSVSGFCRYIEKNFTQVDCKRMKITSPAGFNIRKYLQGKCREFGGEPRNLDDRAWHDPGWLDDPVWRAYLIYKRKTGTYALSRFYHVIKKEAALAGQPDFLVMGNDIPMFALGWPRGDLDMVSTELTWDWSITGGPRGLMPPPLGSYIPVYKLAREHARSRFVNIWFYVPPDQLGKTNIARILYYQGLASHALPMPKYPNNRTAGNKEIDSAFFNFVRDVAPVFGNRVPLEKTGLYFSSSSQIASMTPAGFLDFKNQVHSFSFWGWGTALTWLHVTWRAVPEWKLTSKILEKLHTFIIPNSEVFPESSITVLKSWVQQGGTLIISGNCGKRFGEPRNFELRQNGSSLVSLLKPRDMENPGEPRKLRAFGKENEQLWSIGKGRVLFLSSDPGLPFYKADKIRPSLLPLFDQALALVMNNKVELMLSAKDVPWKIGLTLYMDGNRLFIDANNTNINIKKDVITPSKPLSFTIILPENLRGRNLQLQVLSPDLPPHVDLKKLDNRKVRVILGSFSVYASVIIQPGKNNHVKKE